MLAKIDLVKDSIEIVNPITGKIEKCQIVKALTEGEPLEVLTDLADQKAETQKALKKVEFLESKLTTLSIKDWESYNAL